MSTLPKAAAVTRILNAQFTKAVDLKSSRVKGYRTRMDGFVVSQINEELVAVTRRGVDQGLASDAYAPLPSMGKLLASKGYDVVVLADVINVIRKDIS